MPVPPATIRWSPSDLLLNSSPFPFNKNNCQLIFNNVSFFTWGPSRIISVDSPSERIESWINCENPVGD